MILPRIKVIIGSELSFVDSKNGVKMDEEELIKEFICIKRTNASTEIFVRLISWEGPHNPISQWKIVRTIKKDISDEQIAVELSRILNNRRYFIRCKECNELKPKGWMWEDNICQSCAERNHQVVF